MNTPIYFLSHARLDRENDPRRVIERFFEDLDREVRRRMVIKEGHAGFFDHSGIQQGDNWPDTLLSALQTSRVLLCLYSPAFFNSAYCGKELAVFMKRVRAFADEKGGDAPQLVLPVLLDAPEDLGELPEALELIQYADNAYPELYRENGLGYLLKRNNPDLQDAYQDFLDVLVDRILNNAKAHEMGPLDPPPDISKIQSIFDTLSSPLVRPGEEPTFVQGPRYAQFVYVAASSDEIIQHRAQVEGYGAEGELDWKPFYQGYDYKDEIGLMAQEVATHERFRYQQLDLEDNLTDLIEVAQEARRLVVIIVDTWTLHLSKYQEVMKEYDRRSYWNCPVLIVWNFRDQETINNKGQLEQLLKQTFVSKAVLKNPTYFIDHIGSPDDFKKQLSISLQTVKMKII